MGNSYSSDEHMVTSADRCWSYEPGTVQTQRHKHSEPRRRKRTWTVRAVVGVVEGTRVVTGDSSRDTCTPAAYVACEA